MSPTADESQLEQFGYKQELRRVLGGFDAFALQFSALGLSGALFFAFQSALHSSGPILFLAWCIGAAFQLSVGLSIAELSSAYGINGSCYSWIRNLADGIAAPVTGYILIIAYVSWLALIDNVVSPYLLSLFGVLNPTYLQIFCTSISILCVQTLINLLSIRNISLIINVRALAELTAMIVLLFLLLRAGFHQHSSILFTARWTGTHETVHPFLLLLVGAGTTISGFDVAANASEEVTKPRRVIPLSSMAANLIVYAIGAAVIALPLLALTDLSKAIAATLPLLYIMQTRIGSSFASVMEGVMMITLLFSGIIVQLAASRLIWAQARAGILPRQLHRLNRVGVPATAVVVYAVIVAASWLRADAQAILVVLGGIAFPVAYGITVAVSFHGKLRGKLRSDRPWNLGRWGMVNDILAITWSIPLVLLSAVFNVEYAVIGVMSAAVVITLMCLFWARPRP